MSSEAMAAVRSHERLNDLQFRIMEEKHEEIKKLVEQVCARVDDGFKSIDAKFWSLAIALIFILLGVAGFLIVHTLFK
jgi:hypothetical protein